MSCRLTRNRTVALSTLLLLAIGAAPSIFMNPAPGETVRKEISETAALGISQKNPPAQVVLSSEQKTAVKNDEQEVVDLSVIYPPEGKNPTDDPLALFNTPIVETP